MYKLSAILFIVLGVYYCQMPKYSWLKQEVATKWVIPPELVEGKQIYIGDTYEDISAKLLLEQENEPPSLIGGADAMPGSYYVLANDSAIVSAKFYFNTDNILVSAFFETKLAPLISHDSIARFYIRAFSHYYGKPSIYDWEGYENMKAIEWACPDSGFVSLWYHPYSLQSRTDNSKEGVVIYINNNSPPPRPSHTYPLSKTPYEKLGWKL